MTPLRLRVRHLTLVLGLLALAALAALAAPAAAQDAGPEPRRELPHYGTGTFDGRYPVRLLTIETARMLDRHEGIIGFGDTRYSLIGRRLELTTNTISDVIGVANAGIKIGLLDPERRDPGLAIGGKYYRSIGGLIDTGVERIAESFSTVTNSDVDVSGWVGFATATWSVPGGRTNSHLTVQHHQPLESRFAVEDSVAGGAGTVTFHDGNDTSAMVGFDHQLLDTRLIVLAEAGYSWGLDRPRYGFGVDAGSQHWRVLAGVSFPGVETDIATEPRELYVTPALSLHYRF